MQSIFGQTLKPLEIIVINDGSDERSRRSLDRYAGRCTIVDLPESLGIGHARYLGVQMAKGEFVAFLDDDDVWLPDKLEAQRRYMAEHPDCDYVHGGVWWMLRDKPDEFYPLHWKGALTLEQALTHGYVLIPSATFLRTRVAKDLGYDPKANGIEDHDFQIRCAAAGYRIGCMGDTRVRIRRQGQ